LPPGKDSRTKVKHAAPRAASVPAVPEPARWGDPEVTTRAPSTTADVTHVLSRPFVAAFPLRGEL